MKLLLQFLIILISLSFPLAAQKQLEMETVIQKDTFLVGEEVNFGFGLKNITNSNQQINDGTIDIKILDTACNILQKTGLGTLYDFTPMAKLLLDEGETYQVYDLTEMFGNQKYHGFYKYYFKAGNYQIKIKLTNPNNYIEEKNIKINVVEPQGDESIFFNTFKNILLPIYTLNYNNKLFTEQLENLHATYPNSVYSPSLLDFLSCMLKFGGDSPQYEKAYNFMIELLENFTWSRNALVLIDKTVINGKKSKPEKIDYLKKLLPKCVNSPMHKLIENYIKEETNK